MWATVTLLSSGLSPLVLLRFPKLDPVHLTNRRENNILGEGAVRYVITQENDAEIIGIFFCQKAFTSWA